MTVFLIPLALLVTMAVLIVLLGRAQRAAEAEERKEAALCKLGSHATAYSWQTRCSRCGLELLDGLASRYWLEPEPDWNWPTRNL